MVNLKVISGDKGNFLVNTASTNTTSNNIGFGDTESNHISSLIQQEITKYMNNINSNFLNIVSMLESPGNPKLLALSIFFISYARIHGFWIWVLQTIFHKP